MMPIIIVSTVLLSSAIGLDVLFVFMVFRCGNEIADRRLLLQHFCYIRLFYCISKLALNWSWSFKEPLAIKIFGFVMVNFALTYMIGMTVVSFTRIFAVMKPFLYPSLIKRRKITIFLCLIWFKPAITLLPVLLTRGWHCLESVCLFIFAMLSFLHLVFSSVVFTCLAKRMRNRRRVSMQSMLSTVSRLSFSQTVRRSFRIANSSTKSHKTSFLVTIVFSIFVTLPILVYTTLKLANNTKLTLPSVFYCITDVNFVLYPIIYLTEIPSIKTMLNKILIGKKLHPKVQSSPFLVT